MDKLRKILKSKNLKVQLVIICALGMVLLMLSGNLLNNYRPNIPFTATDVELVSEPNIATNISYEALLEQRLEEVLRNVVGVGRVKVMVTISNGPEIIVAENIALSESHTSEIDASGGTREIKSSSIDRTNIILPTGTPLILKELQPVIEGVIVVAEGGGNLHIAENIINATRAVFGIDAHRIAVMEFGE